MDWATWIEFDRQLLLMINGSDSVFLDGVMTTFTCGWTWLPLFISLFLLVLRNTETLSQVLLVILCCGLCLLFADGMADGIVKPLVGRLRPSHDPVVGQMVDIVNQMRDTKYGFFSAHAANTMSIAVFFSLLVRSRLLSWTLVLWSLANCYTRMYLGLHYPSDILCGLLWGMIAGWMSYRVYAKIHLRVASKTDYISSQYTRKGYSHHDIDMVLSVFMFTLVYVIIRALL